MHVEAFRTKLMLIEGQVKVSNLAHFPCEKFHKGYEAEFPCSFAVEIINDLTVSKRFFDLDGKNGINKTVSKSFDSS